MLDEIFFTRPVDGALFMHEKGFRVFPCKPNAKTPAIDNWQDWAENCTTRRIQDFGTANPTNNWGVYCGPSDLLVVDLDNKPGKNGAQSMSHLVAHNSPLPKTLVVQTPSGGQHIYYVGSQRSTVSTLGPGIDTRGIGGYVVAPGSRIDDNLYALKQNNEIAVLPSWLSSLIDDARKDVVTIEESQLIEEGDRNNILASMAGTMRNRGMNHDVILSALTVLNEQQLETPLPQEEVETIARSISGYKPQDAKAASDFLSIPHLKAMTVDKIDPSVIPPRDWVMQDRYIGGFISVVVAPGGVGKSTLTMLDAVAVATGADITGFEVKKPGAVWIYNTEDPVEELKRRMVAISIHHKIPLDTLSNVHITSGDEAPLILAKNGHDGIVINTNAIDETVDYIRKNKIVLLAVDPFVGTHEVNENDNMQINKVVVIFRRIARRTGCAIALVHHTRKPGANGAGAGDANQARGASSLVNAARIAHTLQGMTKAEAQRFGLEDGRQSWYMRLDNAKANLNAPADRADWYEKVSVDLFNGDSVGTITKVVLKENLGAKRQEEIEAERADLVKALSYLLKVGERMTARDAYNRIAKNKKWEHLFQHYSDSRKGVPFMFKLLESAPCQGNKKFRHIELSEKGAKHWILCEAIVEKKVTKPAAVDEDLGDILA